MHEYRGYPKTGFVVIFAEDFLAACIKALQEHGVSWVEIQDTHNAPNEEARKDRQAYFERMKIVGACVLGSVLKDPPSPERSEKILRLVGDDSTADLLRGGIESKKNGDRLALQKISDLKDHEERTDHYGGICGSAMIAEICDRILNWLPGSPWVPLIGGGWWYEEDSEHAFEIGKNIWMNEIKNI